MNREPAQTRIYLSYLLRLWQEEHNGQLVWRASLESAHDGKRFGFASLQRLFAFLKGQTVRDRQNREQPMAKTMQVTWQILSDDDDWNTEDAVPMPSTVARSSRTRTSWRGIALWMAVGVLAFLVWSQLNRYSRMQTEQEVTQVATQPLAPSAESALPVSPADIVQIDLRGEQAMVQMRVTDPLHPGVWRENRFFEHTSSGWESVEPIPAFWGIHLQSTTDHFRFAYQQRDAEAVSGVSVQLDAMYGKLRRVLGLAPLSASQKQLVRVLGPREQTHLQISDEWIVSVPSPGLLPQPETVGEGEMLLCAVWASLVKRSVDEAIHSPAIAGSWRLSPALERGVRLWAESDGCTTVAESQREQVRAFLHKESALPTLGQLLPGIYDYPYRGESAGQVEQNGLIFATLLAYSARTFGTARLAYFLAEASAPITWEALITAVYDVSVEEFEAGWRVWLAEEYRK